MLTDEERDDVRDILQMYDSLQYAFNKLADKSGLTFDNVHFIGFDTNDDKEYECGQYAKTVYNSNPDDYPTLKVFGEIPNAHFPESERKRGQGTKKGSELFCCVGGP